HCAVDRPVFFAGDFFLEDQNPWWTFESVELLKLPQLEKSVRLPALKLAPPSLDQFKNDFQVIQGAIEEGLIEKAVPIVSAEAPLPEAFYEVLPLVLGNLTEKSSPQRALHYLNDG